ncbi:hypothetical protein [Jannaschia aquimarina]|uniref:Lipoprotein n=1 Tax=Jannaschia aquimarina TaxID=935700 RepID=A0A0D1EH11_9RHOB|nr:hypothetical protein [Jannaschia aquimarina]KIT16939.1 hypothetical protein jaqu_14380 [Jannaschia aquimarina]SNT11153.1 hypothetical protein SAMN05421775_10610 [Jannaschia aquimarina]
MRSTPLIAFAVLVALSACGAEFQDEFPELGGGATDQFTERTLQLQAICFRGQATQIDDGTSRPADLAPRVYDACREDTDLILSRQTRALPTSEREDFIARSRERDLARIVALIEQNRQG